jgi:hypothetical protein
VQTRRRRRTAEPATGCDTEVAVERATGKALRVDEGALKGTESVIDAAQLTSVDALAPGPIV